MYNIIYLMGAGRSGTTALGTFLGRSQDILTVGEMHQFFEHIEEKKNCSCGEKLENCIFWSLILKKLPRDFIDEAQTYRRFCEQFEYHSSVPRHLLNHFSLADIEKYSFINETIFTAISEENEQAYILDSAKYIGRALALSKSKKLNVKIIYVIRDVRGVINSFSKNVQTPRSPLSAIFYYMVVNCTAQFVAMLMPGDKILKLKYEDLIAEPAREIIRIERFLNLDLSEIITRILTRQDFEVGHIIGGNRLKENKCITFKEDISWKKNYSLFNRVLYYMLAFPMMILNRFKI